MPWVQCIIADDHAIVRQGLRSVLEAPGKIEEDGIEVVAEAVNGIETIAALRKLRSHLLVLDVQMPFAGGAEVAVEVRRWSPETRIVVLSGITAPGKLAELVELGVDGLLSKAADNAGLYAVLPRILGGGRVIAQCGGAGERPLQQWVPY